MRRTAGVVAAVVCFLLVPLLAQRGSGQGGQRGAGQGGQRGSAPAAQGAKPSVKIAGDFDKVHILEPGGPAPRTRDGHPDLSGRYYPNHAGRMLQGAYQIDETIIRKLDPAKTPQENPVFRPQAADKCLDTPPSGRCPASATPTAPTTPAP